MKELVELLIQFIVTLCKLSKHGGVKALVAENYALRQQLVAENHALRQQLVAENHALRQQLVAENHALRQQLVAENHALRQQLVTEDHALRQQFVAENHALRQQLVVIRRCNKRSPRLKSLDRFLFGFFAFFIRVLHLRSSSSANCYYC